MPLKLIKHCRSNFFCVWFSLGQSMIILLILIVPNAIETSYTFLKQIFKFYLPNGILGCSRTNIFFCPTLARNPIFVVPNATIIVPNAIETSYTFLIDFFNYICRTGFADVPTIIFISWQ